MDRLTKLLRWRPADALGTPAGPGYPSAQNLAVFQVNQTDTSRCQVRTVAVLPTIWAGSGVRSTARYHWRRSPPRAIARSFLFTYEVARCGYQMITTVNNPSAAEAAHHDGQLPVRYRGPNRLLQLGALGPTSSTGSWPWRARKPTRVRKDRARTSYPPRPSISRRSRIE